MQVSRLVFLELHTHFVQISWQSILARGIRWFWQLTVSKMLSVTFVDFLVCGYKWTFSPFLKSHQYGGHTELQTGLYLSGLLLQILLLQSQMSSQNLNTCKSLIWLHQLQFVQTVINCQICLVCAVFPLSSAFSESVTALWECIIPWEM